VFAWLGLLPSSLRRHIEGRPPRDLTCERRCCGSRRFAGIRGRHLSRSGGAACTSAPSTGAAVVCATPIRSHRAVDLAVEGGGAAGAADGQVLRLQQLLLPGEQPGNVMLSAP